MLQTKLFLSPFTLVTKSFQNTVAQHRGSLSSPSCSIRSSLPNISQTEPNLPSSFRESSHFIDANSSPSFTYVPQTRANVENLRRQMNQSLGYTLNTEECISRFYFHFIDS
jgi:hypothetical protein